MPMPMVEINSAEEVRASYLAHHICIRCVSDATDDDTSPKRSLSFTLPVSTSPMPSGQLIRHLGFTLDCSVGLIPLASAPAVTCGARESGGGPFHWTRFFTRINRLQATSCRTPRVSHTWRSSHRPLDSPPVPRQQAFALGIALSGGLYFPPAFRLPAFASWDLLLPLENCPLLTGWLLLRSSLLRLHWGYPVQLVRHATLGGAFSTPGEW